MPKLQVLTNQELKEILKSYALPQGGTKAEMVARLTKHMATDEIDDESLNQILTAPNNGIQEQINDLKKLMVDLSNKISDLSERPPSVLVTPDTNNATSTTTQQHENRADTLLVRNRFSVKEISETIPEYDPTDDKSVSAEQFIQHVESAATAYDFEVKCLLLAVYSRLKGAARIWLDGRQTFFSSWADFKRALLEEFGVQFNEAEVSAKMSKTTRRADEKPVDYCFRMHALGNRLGLSEQAIIKFTRDGLRNRELQLAIATTKFVNMKSLRETIMEYSVNTASTSRYVNEGNIYKGSSKQIDGRTTIKQENQTKEIICYNCNDKGHISKDCPKPQRRERCAICQKTSHKTEKCYQRTENNKTKGNVNTVTESNETYREVIKSIKVNGQTRIAFLDSGSAMSLIREKGVMASTDTISCHTVLTGFAGGEYIAKKKINATIKIDDNVFNTQLFIVEDGNLPEDVLIGRDILCKQGYRFVIEGEQCRLETMTIANPKNVLTAEQQMKLDNVIRTNSNCFADNISELGKCSSMEMEIKLTSDQPVNLKPYRIAFAKRNIVSEIINDLLRYDIIRPSTSSFASPVVLVEKKNGEHRLCVDYRCLNKITLKTPFPMPIMEEQFAQLSGKAYFTSLDLRMGYHQIAMQENSKPITAFITTDGHYEFNRMPFGLVNAPAVFQRLMNVLLTEMNAGEALAYLDDVIIPSETVEDGLQSLNKFLLVLAKHGLTLRTDKCRFFQTEIQHLGHIICKDGIKPGSIKINAIKQFKVPENVTEVRRFLGLTGFFRKFVENYAIIARPLTNLLSKTKNENFTWTNLQQEAFDNLINKLTTAPVLDLYDMKQKHEVHTDACSVGLAGILLQSRDNTSWRTVMYFSRRCTEAEQKYHSYELEVLAVTETLQRFRVYLMGKPFHVVTDCAAIAMTKEQRELKPRIARWWMRLQEFDFTIQHRAGSRMAHVDAMSRAPVESPSISASAGCIYAIDTTDWVTAMQHNDERARHIFDTLAGRIKSSEEQQLRQEFIIKNQRLYRMEGDKLKLYVPKSTRWGLVRHFHDDMGHFALEKTLNRMKKLFWFPKMRKIVKEYINACISCCYNKFQRSKPQGSLNVNAPEPIPFHLLHMDHVGPFVKSRKGNVYVLTISDAFTKFCILKPVRNTKTTAVINALNEIVSYFGMPSKIVTDRGTAFTSKMFNDFCKSNNITHIQTAVRTPRSNGQAERANETLLNALRCSTENTRDWDNEIMKIQWAINTQTNSTTKFTPNELIFNFDIRDVAHNHLVAAVVADVGEQKSVYTPDEKKKIALDNIAIERAKWKIRFDNRHAVPTKYNVDDLVVIRNEPQATGESRKLAPKYRGPYRVDKVLGCDRYVITDIPGMQVTNRPFSSVFASDLMKPWCKTYPELDITDNEEDEADDITDLSRDDLESGEGRAVTPLE